MVLEGEVRPRGSLYAREVSEGARDLLYRLVRTPRAALDGRSGLSCARSRDWTRSR